MTGFYAKLELTTDIEKRLAGVVLHGLSEDLSEAEIIHELSTIAAAASDEERPTVLRVIRFIFTSPYRQQGLSPDGDKPYSYIL